MRKLLASMLSLAAIGGPVTVAFAAQDGDAAVPAGPPATAVDSEVARFDAVDLVAERRAQRADRRAAEKRRERRAQAAVSPALEAIAACESGGDPGAVGGGGTYRGKYQFSRETWASVGGSGDPADAKESEQDRRAQTLYERDGAGHWPVCG